MPGTATRVFRSRLTLLLRVARCGWPESAPERYRPLCIPRRNWERQTFRAAASPCRRSTDADGPISSAEDNRNLCVPIVPRTSSVVGSRDRYAPAQNSPYILALRVPKPYPAHKRRRVCALHAVLREYLEARWSFARWPPSPGKEPARIDDR